MRKNIMRGTGGRSFPDGGSQFGRNFDPKKGFENRLFFKK